MDRELSSSTIVQERIKSALKVILPIIILGAVAVYAGGMLSPSLPASQIRFAAVEEGSLEGILDASGVVMPEFDIVLTSPIEARVLRVLKRAGDSVHKGEAVLELDVRSAEVALEKLSDNIALKRNSAAQLKATLTSKLQQLEHTINIKRREIESDSNNLVQNQRLFEKGYISQGELQKFVIQAKKSADELDALLKDYRNAQVSSALQQEGVALEMAILQKDQSQSLRELEQATTKAEQNGVVTWVLQTVGLPVRKGEMIARIADLSSFRVDASITDVQRHRLIVGMPVVMKVNAGSEIIYGFVSGIQPTVENGIVKFTVGLEKKLHSNLKPNARVDVGVVIARQAKTLKLRRGAYFRGEGQTDVFVLKKEGSSRVAVKTRVIIGISNNEYCEIRGGLQKGDTVILSSMKDFEHQEHVSIREK